MSRYVIGSTNRCANCGKDVEDTEHILPTGEDNEWTCSKKCMLMYEKLGCPLETGGYRI